MIKKNLDKILIFFGCIIIMSAITIKIITNYKQKKLIDDYNNYILNMQKEDSEFNENEEIVKDEFVDDKLENLIGLLSIPKIDLSVAISQGVDNENLKYSVGHFKETALPGEKGNFCLIGHRSYTYGQFFNRLNEISIGDEIIVDSNNKEYKYKVTNVKVVEPEEISVLNQENDSEITLITCTPIRIATHRLIVKGLLE